jgi:hypothetical protein
MPACGNLMGVKTYRMMYSASGGSVLLLWVSTLYMYSSWPQDIVTFLSLFSKEQIHQNVNIQVTFDLFFLLKEK